MDKKERKIKAQIYIYKTLNKYIFKYTISNKYKRNTLRAY